MPTKRNPKAQKPVKREPKPDAATTAPPPPEAPRASSDKGDKSDAKWRAAEERLTLRLAVLEDVVRRANVNLARRVGELEKRRAGAAA